MQKLTQQLKEDIETYLSYCVSEGVMDVEEATELLKEENWGKVKQLMERGDYYADLNHEESFE